MRIQGDMKRIRDLMGCVKCLSMLGFGIKTIVKQTGLTHSTIARLKHGWRLKSNAAVSRIRQVLRHSQARPNLPTQTKANLAHAGAVAFEQWQWAKSEASYFKKYKVFFGVSKIVARRDYLNNRQYYLDLARDYARSESGKRARHERRRLARLNLSDGYIKDFLALDMGIGWKDIPADLVAVYREKLKLRRLIKQINHGKEKQYKPITV